METPSWPCQLFDENSSSLAKAVFQEEIKATLWSLKPFKAPSPNGLPARFFQNAWNIVGELVVNEISSIFQSRVMHANLNQTLVTLIPKCDDTESLNS